VGAFWRTQKKCTLGLKNLDLLIDLTDEVEYEGSAVGISGMGMA
jgi:hypothetical protein